MYLCNLGAFALWWYPPKRCVLARSESVRRQFRVPDGAVLVGRYEHGIAAADIVRDLDELLARLPEAAPEPVTPPKSSEAEPAKAAPAREAGAGRTKSGARKSPPPSHPWRASSGS